MNSVTIEQAMQLAVAHHRAQRLTEAEQIYRQIVAARPDHADALRLLGAIAVQTGHLDAGIELMRRAISINPRAAAYHVDLGSALQRKGDIDAAFACFEEAIRISPNEPAAHNNLGVIFDMRDQIDRAVSSFRHAIRLKPDYAEAHNNLGHALCKKREWDEAIAACRDALRINREYADAHLNLGNALRGKGELDEAIASYRRAILLRPDAAEVHSNLGNALKENGELDESIAAHRKAVAMKPDLTMAHCNLGYALLLSGDFRHGWLENEWRLKKSTWQTKYFPGPRWNGEDLDGKTIVLWGEQGFGDVIQFVRFAPMVAHRGARVVIWCQAELTRLLRSNCELGEIVPSDADVPGHDFHCPLMSLPAVFNTVLETIPAPASYLQSDPALVETWKTRLRDSDRKLKVGLAWAGNPRFQEDRIRSLKLERLAPLQAARNARFFSLQKGEAAMQAKNPPARLEIIDLSSEISDLADTAAVMSQMDLIVTTDTCVAHLAGALARPVWVMLSFSPDFRWLLVRGDSPWYPTMRLFRQKSRADWDSVIHRVAQALLSYGN